MARSERKANPNYTYFYFSRPSGMVALRRGEAE
jgi:hypothetical protein